MGPISLSLAGRSAIVTGASSGMGAAIARAMAAAGARVALVGRDETRLNAVAADIQARGGVGQIVVADVTADGAPALIVESALRAFGSIEILVNAAGVFEPAPFDETPLESLDRQWLVNARAPFALTQAALPHLRPGSSVLFFSSVAGQVGSPAAPAYSMTKGAVERLVDALAVSLSPRGIRVNAIAPGNIRTPMNERFFSNPELEARTVAQTPARRIGRVEDIAGAAVFLASDLADYVHGVSLLVDGGLAVYRGGLQTSATSPALD
jgi:glucose 1-dehydrogenase